MVIRKIEFPPEVQEFAREIHNHPDLMEMINKLNEVDLENILSVTCTYLGLTIDGYYGGNEVIKLIDILLRALLKKRQIIIH